MKNEECRSTRPALRVWKFFFILHFSFCISRCFAAELFGDISVDPNAIYTGNTFHGYAEVRVNLQNHSTVKTHVVTLVFPNRSYGNGGNTISRELRTVKLEPGAIEVVSLLQPPLPSNGDGSISVEVDYHHEGDVRAPNANNHCNSYSRGGAAATVFISRSLDFDAVERVFEANRGAFTAAMVVGPPDATAVGGYDPHTWMPDTRRSGVANWLEVDYASPQSVAKVSIRCTQPLPTSGVIQLIGVSGTNLLQISMSAGGPISLGSGWEMDFIFPATVERVKTVHLDFGTAPPYNIAIDAVEISGPSGRQWASDARASSDASASAGRYAPGGMPTETFESLRAESPVSEWSENWLAYSPFDIIVLNASDIGSMTPAVLGALGDYLSAGGNILLSGTADLPAAWHPTQKKNVQNGVDYSIGFGDCYAFPSRNLSQLDSQTARNLRTSVLASARYWQGLPNDSAGANAALPVVENLKIPVRGIVVIMLAFIIVIGPVNIVLLNRRRRRTWMLWTIPAISLATTLIVFAYSLLREGITPDTRIAGLTLIDQASHHATTTGATAFYCPLTPSDGLRFNYETEATPLVSLNFGSSGSSRDVDWTQLQHLQHGWVSARVPVHFHLRKSETRRERIQVVNENGKIAIINGLGAPIKSIWIADVDMNVFQASDVPAGNKAAVALSNLTRTSEKEGATGLLHDITFAAHTDSLNTMAGKYLQPDTYIAVLDGNPFIENALGSASSPKRTKSSSVVFGILEPTPVK